MNQLKEEFESATKLHQLWAMTLEDLALTEQDDKYEVAMCVYYNKPKDICYVCAADCLVRRGRVDLHEILIQEGQSRKDATWSKLEAIDALRMGNIEFAFRRIGYNFPKDKLKVFPIFDYHCDKEMFWQDARKLLEYLKQEDL